MATGPGDLEKALRNMELFAADHMISSMRPQLSKGVLEAKYTFEKELSKLKAENEELEKNLMETMGTPRVPVIITEAETKKTKGIQQPPGPIDIGRPYPVYVICYKCGTRVLTRVEKDSDEVGCCGFTSESNTKLHMCPLCGALVGIYKKN